MKKKTKNLYKIYQILFKAFGPQKWWPGKTRFEVIVGAVLTQNTAWSNVEKAIKNLKDAGLLNLKALFKTPSPRLYPQLKPSGYFRVKSDRLKNVVRFLYNDYHGDLNRLFNKPQGVAREELLSVKGIGPETADSILLYAGAKPVFVIDAYTRRIFERLGYFKPKASYEYIQRLFMENLPKDAKLYNEYHALIVRLGKDICKKKPQCSICPLDNCCDKRKTKSTNG